MVFIWRGLGLLTPLIYFLAYYLMAICIGMFDLDIDIDISNPKFLWCIAISGGLAIWFFGKSINSPRMNSEGKEVKNRHCLFFIPVQHWAFIIAFFVFYMQMTILKRFAYVQEMYENSRVDFFAKKQKLLNLIENPKPGDFYYFHIDNADWDGNKKGKQPYRGMKTLAYKVVDVRESELQFLAPVERGKNIYPHEDTHMYFQDTITGESDIVWVKRLTLLGTVAQNFHKKDLFSGCSIPALNIKGNLTARLYEIKRQ